MLSDGGGVNKKYKLLGFDNRKGLAVVMVIATGKVLRIKLNELLSSEIADDLNKLEVREIYRKFYSHGVAPSVYEVTDRHECSWMTYVSLNLMLFALYVFTNVSAAKPIYLDAFDIVVTPGVFLYPFTFLIVDLLNEFYGLRLARKAILFVFSSNALIIVLLSVSTYAPGLPDWALDAHYDEVVGHIASALVASSVAFLVSEYLNSYLLCKIKELTNSRFLFLRVFLSTFFAIIIDSFLFFYIAFYGVMTGSDILAMVGVQIMIKMFFALFNIFPAYGARSIFRRYVANVQVT
ncbi:queuosine precursor transporter [Pseudomonas sp. NPDC087639]|uniref:queuosine precursor transporter n=1 Tax=Pseudomonas sp. NPDC087639 TaxID=3364445 RepID=UPI0037F4E234